MQLVIPEASTYGNTTPHTPLLSEEKDQQHHK